MDISIFSPIPLSDTLLRHQEKPILSLRPLSDIPLRDPPQSPKPFSNFQYFKSQNLLCRASPLTGLGAVIGFLKVIVMLIFMSAECLSSCIVCQRRVSSSTIFCCGKKGIQKGRLFRKTTKRKKKVDFAMGRRFTHYRYPISEYVSDRN